MRAQTSASWGATALDVCAAGVGRLPVEQVSDSEVEILDDDLDFSWAIATSAVMVEDAAEAATRSLLALGVGPPPPFRRFGGGLLVLSEVGADVAGDEEFAMESFGEEEFDLTSPTSTACSLGSPVSASLLMKLVEADEADVTHQVAVDSDEVHAGEGCFFEEWLQSYTASQGDWLFDFACSVLDEGIRTHVVTTSEFPWEADAEFPMPVASVGPAEDCSPEVCSNVDDASVALEQMLAAEDAAASPRAADLEERSPVSSPSGRQAARSRTRHRVFGGVARSLAVVRMDDDDDAAAARGSPARQSSLVRGYETLGAEIHNLVAADQKGMGSSCGSPGTLRAVQPLLPVRPKAHTGLLRTSSCLGSSLRAASALALDLGEEACKDGLSGSLFRPRGAAVLPPTLPPGRALGASASLPSLSKGRPQEFGKLAAPHRASPLVSDHSAGSLAWGRRSARRAPWLQGTAGRGAAF